MRDLLQDLCVLLVAVEGCSEEHSAGYNAKLGGHRPGVRDVCMCMGGGGPDIQAAAITYTLVPNVS